MDTNGMTSQRLSPNGREAEALLRIGGAAAPRLAQHRVRDYARGIWPEDRRLRRAPVALKRLRRGQLALVSPPASVQFYKLPSLFCLASRRGSAMPFSHLVQSSSASRFTAGASGFFILSQSGERPEW